MAEKPRITVRLHGPIWIQGDVDLVDQDGNPLTPPPAKTPGMIKLCRCGQSSNQPFCDGTHNKQCD
jgi:CDGSH-type Zn-finger protein